MGSELQAERLLTSILKEKLYSKEKEVEHIQAELARALRSDDVLKKEIQNAADTVSCVNHKMKNLELQVSFIHFCLKHLTLFTTNHLGLCSLKVFISLINIRRCRRDVILIFVNLHANTHCSFN